jgi:hypothetical protein
MWIPAAVNTASKALVNLASRSRRADGPGGCGVRLRMPHAAGSWRARSPRARAGPVSEAAQLALDAGHAPRPVFAGQAGDQLDELVVGRWSSWWPGLGPLRGHRAAVPAQQGSRGHDLVEAQLFRQRPGQRRDDGPVSPFEPGLGFTRCGTATSWRSTSISVFFDADERASGASQDSIATANW